jgi:Holliday junction resolvase
MTNYAKGARSEKKTRVWLEAQGYWVIEARGSHGAVDLVAINPDRVLLIQVKSGRALGPKEHRLAVDALLAIPIPTIGERWLLSWPKYARTPTVEMV